MKYRVFRHTTDVALDEDFAPGVAWQLEGIRMHLSAGGAAADLVVWQKMAASTVAGEYDAVLTSVDMTGVSNVFWQPARPIPFGSDDVLTVEYTNGGGAVIGLEVWVSAI